MGQFIRNGKRNTQKLWAKEETMLSIPAITATDKIPSQAGSPFVATINMFIRNGAIVVVEYDKAEWPVTKVIVFNEMFYKIHINMLGVERAVYKLRGHNPFIIYERIVL